MSAPVPHHLAGPVSRTIAYLLDALLVAVVFTGGAVMTSTIASFIGAQAHDFVRAVASAYLVVLPAMLASYSALFWTLAGRTPGMALLGLRVVATRGRSMSWLSVLVRAVVLAYLPIGAVWALVDHRHQGVHDKLAGTAVVRVSSAPPAPPADALIQLRRG
jgi:uncharacterized RDD family membrane protein YckC